MKNKVEVHENNKDLLDNIPTVEDLGEMLGKSIAERIKKNPIDFANKLREDNVINDEEYKEMIMNIKKHKLEEDF
jgi:Asp-tRNA(Asn)/Glu-tRNA(Gln) amidotransferase C subunit